MYDCVIIGAGPAGVACAIYVKQAGYNVAIIENELVGGQPLLTDNITNVVGFVGNGEQFGEVLSKQLEDNKIEVLYGYGHIKSNKLYLDEEEVETKCIVIATGAKPNKIPEIDNAHYCALCDGILYKGKKVIVIGSGNVAYGEAIHLSKITSNVILLHNNDFPILANHDLQEEIKELDNVEILNYDNIIDNSNKILTVKSNEAVSQISYDGIFVSIGRTPNLDCIESNDVSFYDYDVYIDRIHDRVFAVGDVLNKPIKQISTAINDGVICSQKIIKNLKENH